MNLLIRFRRRNFLLATLLLGLASPLAAQQKTVAIPLADGFDYPIGKPDGKGYYVARGLRLREPIHFGEDWNGIALTLSTARPGLGGAAPEIAPWYVDVSQPIAYGIVSDRMN
ncbi:MAG: DUF4139 domain-containing protein, partial [Planctomycetia bacterium]|nr:DUF4139 domain-containing protein [Planctomycetia bacterium]